MKRLIALIMLFLMLVPPVFAQDYRTPSNYDPRAGNYYPSARTYQRQPSFRIDRPGSNTPTPEAYTTNPYGLQDPIYHGDFRLLGGLQIDEKLMKVSDAARDAAHILDQVSSTMSSCLQFGEQEQRLQEDYRVLDSNPAGASAASKFRQVEALVRQAKVEFEAYGRDRQDGHDGNDQHVKAGAKLLEQAQDILKGSEPLLAKLWEAAQGVAGAASQLASMVNQFRPPPSGNTMPPLAPPINRVQGNVIPPGSGSNSPIPPNTGGNTTKPPTTNGNSGTQPNTGGNGTPQSGGQTKDPGTFTKPNPISDKPNHPNLDQKLKTFAESLQRRALDGITDPNERAKTIHNVSEKFTGIGEGLNEAKEEVKHGATAAFKAAVQQTEAFKKDPAGTLSASAEAAEAFGKSFANATEAALDAVSNTTLEELLKGSVAKAVEASNNYSKLPPREQGKFLGKVLFWSINPSGSIDGGQLTGQAFRRAGEAIKPHAAQLNSELKMLAAAGKDKLAAGEAKLAALASNMGSSQKPALATLGPNIPRGPPGPSAIDDLYNLMVKGEGEAGAGTSGSGLLKAGTKIGNIVVDDKPLVGGIFDGQKVTNGIKWPTGWRKPKAGSFLSSEGKLYFKPDEQFRQALGLGPDDLIPYTEKGIPDFIKWTPDNQNHLYKGTLTGFSTQDTNLLASDLASKGWKGLKTQAEVLREFDSMGVTVHHFDILPDGTHALQLVNRNIHAQVRHTGTSKIIREGL